MHDYINKFKLDIIFLKIDKKVESINKWIIKK